MGFLVETPLAASPPGEKWTETSALISVPGAEQGVARMVVHYDAARWTSDEAIAWAAHEVGGNALDGDASAAFVLDEHRWAPGPIGFKIVSSPIRKALTLREARAAIIAGARSWNSEAIEFQYLGEVAGPAVAARDGQSLVAFSDTLPDGFGGYAVIYCTNCVPGIGEFDIVHRLTWIFSETNPAGLADDSLAALVALSTHEFGHVAGLDHSAEPECGLLFGEGPVMCATVKNMFPQRDDVEGLEKAYGRDGPPPAETFSVVPFAPGMFASALANDEILAFSESGTVCGRAPASEANGSVFIWVMPHMDEYPGCGKPGAKIWFYLPRTREFIGEAIEWRAWETSLILVEPGSALPQRLRLPGVASD